MSADTLAVLVLVAVLPSVPVREASRLRRPEARSERVDSLRRAIDSVSAESARRTAERLEPLFIGKPRDTPEVVERLIISSGYIDIIKWLP